MVHLQLSEENTDIVFKTPDRPNIYLGILKRESSEYEISLEWLIDHIRENGIKSKKTIIYCRSIDTVSEIFCTLRACLGIKAYADGIKDSDHALVEMFHKSTHPDSKDRILKEFKSEQSHLRCVVATVALGMGLDIRDIDFVLHIGCPKTILSYWQEAGRCARDGRQGFSLILFDRFTLSLKTTEKTIAEVVLNKDNKCIRQQLLNHLAYDEEVCVSLSPESCSGCDLLQCQCSSCKCCSSCIEKCPCQARRKFNIQTFFKNAVKL